ncbi:glycoside hydrolase family 26 protein [Rhodoblastus acidophilus]|nr:glycosyl hydrolase [Rhodoblastus acidophilus]
MLPVIFGIVVSGSMASAQTANPNATTDARHLLAFLADLPFRSDHPIISGQMLGSIEGFGNGPDDNMSAGYRNYVEKLRAQTGKTIGVAGVNFGRLTGCSIDNPLMSGHKSPLMNCDGSPPDYRIDVDILTQHWRAGGLISVMWHAPNPWTGGGAHDVRILGNFSDLYTPRSALYATWRKMLDDVAVGLKLLQDNGVIVLFRPLHEQNGNWFWWGDHGANAHPSNEEFVTLWRDMFNYFTNEKHLNNLLWVFSPNRNDSQQQNIMRFAPGPQFYDIVGLDYYEDEREKPVDFSTLIAAGKPIAIAEFGPLDSFSSNPSTTHQYDFLRIIRLRERFPRFSYFMAWHGTHSPQAIIQNRNCEELLTRSDVLSVGNITWKKH